MNKFELFMHQNTSQMEPTRKHKVALGSHKLHGPAEWVAVIKSKIQDLHLQGWVASILAWDYDNDEAWKELTPLIEQYRLDKSRKVYSGDIQTALEAVGYLYAESRCKVAQDKGEENRSHTRSSSWDGFIARTWSDSGQDRESRGTVPSREAV